MGQLADSLREIIQTMKDGYEILRQNIKEIEKSAEALVNAADDLVETIED